MCPASDIQHDTYVVQTFGAVAEWAQDVHGCAFIRPPRGTNLAQSILPAGREDQPCVVTEVGQSRDPLSGASFASFLPPMPAMQRGGPSSIFKMRHGKRNCRHGVPKKP